MPNRLFENSKRNSLHHVSKKMCFYLKRILGATKELEFCGNI